MNIESLDNAKRNIEEAEEKIITLANKFTENMIFIDGDGGPVLDIKTIIEDKNELLKNAMGYIDDVINNVGNI